MTAIVFGCGGLNSRVTCEAMTMRLEAIRHRKACFSTAIQQFVSVDISDQIVDRFCLTPRDPIKRKALRLIAPCALQLQQTRTRKTLSCEIPFDVSWLTLGERFADDVSLGLLLKKTRGGRISRVLVPGCYVASEDVQFWLRRGIDHLAGIDVYNLEKRWAVILPQLRAHFGANIDFRQASIEKLPFEDGSFDLIASRAVLEHVRNLRAMVCETARVLRPGGWAWHSFGPLYYSPGGDHCIGVYGLVASYDHLLLEEEDYRSKIADQSFFHRQSDPNLPFWALKEQFSFAEPGGYLELFSAYFEIEHVVVKVSEEALRFRLLYPEKWQTLVAAGLHESSLLIKGLAVVLRKKTAVVASDLDSGWQHAHSLVR